MARAGTALGTSGKPLRGHPAHGDKSWRRFVRDTHTAPAPVEADSSRVKAAMSQRWRFIFMKLSHAILITALLFCACTPDIHVGLKTLPGDDPYQTDRTKR